MACDAFAARLIASTVEGTTGSDFFGGLFGSGVGVIALLGVLKSRCVGRNIGLGGAVVMGVWLGLAYLEESGCLVG